MKKTLVLALLAVLALHAQAQKTTVKMQETQARALDMQANGYVRPLTVELQVIDPAAGSVRDIWPLTKEQAEVEMHGDLQNIRSYAVYMSSKKHKADVIVAATFNFRTSEQTGGYEIEVVGFPAKFVNWKTATPADLEWIRMEKVQTTSERDKLGAVVK